MSLASRAVVYQIDTSDNVGVALVDLVGNDDVTVSGDRTLHVQGEVPFGHKVALVEIPAGQPVVKYGETIGLAVANIGPGDHVHVHNVVSTR